MAADADLVWDGAPLLTDETPVLLRLELLVPMPFLAEDVLPSDDEAMPEVLVTPWA